MYVKNILLFCSFSIVLGCVASPNKTEREFVTQSGEVASEDEVLRVKQVCGYNEKMKEVTANIKIAMSVGRYENQYGPKKSTKYVEEASRIMAEVAECMSENGLRSREKKIHNQ